MTATYGVTVDGTLEPSGGTLSITGNGNGRLTLHNSAAMLSNVTPTSQDNVTVSATASLGGRLAVTMTGTFTPRCAIHSLARGWRADRHFRQRRFN